MACTLSHPYESGSFGEGEALRPGGCELTLHAIDSAAFEAGERVLDLGCGEGAGSALLHAHGCQVIALDRVAASAAATSEALGLAGVAGDAHRLPFADASMDGVLAECSLSLAGYHSAALAECYRVLRPGGRIAVTDMYARKDEASGTALPGCLAGLVPRAGVLASIAAAGLTVQRWEDHSEVLKSFLAQLIFSGRGAESLWTGDGSAFSAALRASRPGYFMLIAARPPRRH